MVIGFNNNDYGITRQEFKQFKKEMQLKDLQNDKIELTKQDYKEIKKHIKNGDLGKYLDNVSEEMRNAMGLSLKGKVDDSPIRKTPVRVDGNVQAARRLPSRNGFGLVNAPAVRYMIETLPEDVDRSKVLNHIAAADEARIDELMSKSFEPLMKALEDGATRERIEQSFNNSPFMKALDDLSPKFGLN